MVGMQALGLEFAALDRDIVRVLSRALGFRVRVLGLGLGLGFRV